MKTLHSDAQLLVDMIIVEALLSEEGVYKTAQAGGVIADLTGKVSHYFSNQVDPDNKTKSLLNMIAPGVIFTTLGALGLPWWFRVLLSLATAVFHIDVAGILESIYHKIASAIGVGKPLTSSQVDEMVTGSVQEHTQTATQDEADKAAELLHAKSHTQSIREAKLLKLALIDYDYMVKTGAPASSFFSRFSAKKAATTSILSKVLSWIFRVALASAGFLVAGDVINKFLGRPNALDDSVQKGKPVATSTTPATTSIPAVVSKQTKFPVNPSYHEENLNVSSNWVEQAPNTQAGIESMLLDFAKEVYQGLDGQDSNIRSTPGFQAIADAIAWYNHTSTGGPVVFIPKMFTSKKKIVDHFIDDVAEKAS